MDIFSKPTDSKRYILYDSNHPKPCTKNIPFFLAKRICAIVENTNMKLIKLEKLKTTSVFQRYTIKTVENTTHSSSNPTFA